MSIERKMEYTLWVYIDASVEPFDTGSVHRRGQFENHTEGVGGMSRLYRLFSLYRFILLCRIFLLYWLILLSNSDRFQGVCRLIWRM